MKLAPTPQMQSWKWTCHVKSDDSYRDVDWEGFIRLIENDEITPDSWIRWSGLASGGVNYEDLINNDFFYDDYGKIIPVPSEQELHQLASDPIMCRIRATTRVWGKNI